MILPFQIYCDYLEDKGIDTRLLRTQNVEGITVNCIGLVRLIFRYDGAYQRGNGYGYGRGSEWAYYGWADGDGDNCNVQPDGDGYGDGWGYGIEDVLIESIGNGLGDGRHYFSEFTFPNIM